MTNYHQRIRELFDELVELAEPEQNIRLEIIRTNEAELALELEKLLAIERTDARLITRASQFAIASTIRRAETKELLKTDVGKFTLVEEIGRGGVGVVFKGVRREGELQHVVAIKMLQSAQINHRSVERFLRERAFLANLKHPNICEFIDSGVSESGFPYVVMELIEGRDLLTYARDLQLDIEQRLQLFLTVLQGVECAHQNLVIHRDLKPSNIIINQYGIAKLVDFGIARSISSSVSNETERWFTAQYCAPEQFRGDHLTTSCDIYSLGVILFELLSGKSLFAHENVSIGEFERYVLEVPAPLMRLGTDKSRWRFWAGGRLNELDAVTQKALRKEPTERYRSVAEFAQDLRHWLAQRPVLAKGNHLGYRLKKFSQRNRMAVTASTVMAIILIGAVVQSLRQNEITKLERNRAELALSIMTDAFAAADPLHASKGEMNVRTVLKASTDRLLELDDQHAADLVQVGLKIASVQSRLGLTQDSKLLAEAAYKKAIDLGDEESRIALNRLRAQAEIILGNLIGARTLLEQESNKHARAHPEYLFLMAETFTYEEQNMQIKEQYLLQSIAAFESQADLPTAVLAGIRLAELNYRTDRKAEALSIANDNLKKFRQRQGPQSASAIRAEFYLLNLQQRLGSSGTVIADGLALLPRIEKTYGKDSSTYGAIHSLLASAYRSANQPAVAVVHNRVVYETYRGTMGALHESTLREFLNLAFTMKRVASLQTETIETFSHVVRDALASNLLDEEFRHYAVASAALYFRSVGKHQLAMETLANPSYQPDVASWDAARQADFANDLWLIGADAGCATERDQLCDTDAHARCPQLAKRYCEIIALL